MKKYGVWRKIAKILGSLFAILVVVVILVYLLVLQYPNLKDSPAVNGKNNSYGLNLLDKEYK
ncbi:hypothetical protein HBE96_11775 [Clostridium sp. P21]|uniref:Uncharacterized protein n=1 Tax=Clostridium muellerianum TaxID=2716538 RepID=A0A7Y0EH35_9CLOT|nr:hypothetical protein [Clostridium muellerianum]NMM63343.1 hypothetical protein [Clostridium muellerianum]